MQEFECNQDNGTKQNVFVLESDSRVSNGMKRADDDDDDDDVKNISQLHFCIISATRKLYIRAASQRQYPYSSWKFLNTQGQFCRGGGGSHKRMDRVLIIALKG